jgi:hypothetical protein
MFRRVMTAAVLLAMTPFAACDAEGPSCCALRKFCTTCTTCSSDNNTMATKGDETACKRVVEQFKTNGQFCNVEDAPPKHAIDEFLLECQ